MTFLPEDTVTNEFIGFYASEPEYRADKEAWNYSKLKDFTKDPLLVWRKKYILGDYEFKTTPEMEYGSLVDCMQFEPHLKDEKFAIASAPTPTENNLNFVNALIELIKNSEEVDLNVELYEKAYTAAGIKSPKFENYIKDRFVGTDVEAYFAEKLESIGKTTMGLEQFEAAERVLRMLNESESTRDIFKYKGEVIQYDDKGNIVLHIEGKAQFGLKARVDGVLIRVLLDWVLVNHLNKTISPYDMKTTAMGVEDFRYTFFKMKYYIQQGLYEAVVAEWAAEYYPDYEVKPFQFIVVDSSGFIEPLVYEITAPQGQSFLYTFNLGDRVYKSGLDIIDDINYHIENNIWTISRTNKLNQGKVKISL